MTITSTFSKEIKNGNGAATAFGFAFVINQAADLQVIFTSADGVETLLAEGAGTANYSLSVASYPGSGSITYPASGSGRLAAGETLTLARVVALEQQTDLINQGDWNPEEVEAAFDYGRMVDIQQQEELDRTLKGRSRRPAAASTSRCRRRSR